MENYPINLKLSRNLDNIRKKTKHETHRKSFSVSTVTKFSSIDTFRNMRNYKRAKTRMKTKMMTRLSTFDSLRKSVFSPTITLPKEFNLLSHNFEYRKIIPLSKKMNTIPVKKNTFLKSNKNKIVFTDRKKLKLQYEYLKLILKSFNSLLEITHKDYYKKVYNDNDIEKKKVKSKSKNLNIRTYFDKPKKNIIQLMK